MTRSQIHAQINTLTVRGGLAYHAAQRSTGKRAADNLTFARAAYSRAAFLRSKLK